MPDQLNRPAIMMVVLVSMFATLAGCGSGSTPADSSPPAAGAGSGEPPPTVSIPPTPANLAATPADTQVSLTWSQSTGATSYSVKRGTASGGPYTQVGTPAVLTFTDTSLTNGTTYYYVVSALDSAGESANSAEVSGKPTAPPAPPATADVTITVTSSAHHSISPYIYGANFASKVVNAPPSLTFDRTGGNRWTAYNWVTNASNAGSDYLYENDAYLTSSTTPGAAVTDIISVDQNSGMASLVTFQMQGLVAADESGPVDVSHPPDLSRFKNVVFAKGSGFTATPSSSLPNVYMDEFIWAIDHKFAGQNIFGTTPSTQHVFAQLDNEPELWKSTHLEVQGPTAVTADAYIAKTISLATALKQQFPNLVIFGPAHYGFFGLYAWQGELSPTASGNNWFTDKYLLAMKAASATFGSPLVDIYDFHWYPEATDSANVRITGLNGASLSDDQVQAIVQSPRSLWDPTYTEKSWIAQSLGGPVNILGRLQAKIAAEYPGTRLSITEYNNGGAQHIAGTIAQADNLGVFGAQSLFAANLWPLQDNEGYLLAGFRAYRDFDGANHNFGDTSVAATSSSVGNVVVYVSTDSGRPGRVVMVAINRSTSTQVTAINGQALTGTAHLFQMTATSAAGQSVVQPVAAGSQAVSGNSLTVSLPALSVTTIDIY